MRSLPGQSCANPKVLTGLRVRAPAGTHFLTCPLRTRYLLCAYAPIWHSDYQKIADRPGKRLAYVTKPRRLSLSEPCLIPQTGRDYDSTTNEYPLVKARARVQFSPSTIPDPPIRILCNRTDSDVRLCFDIFDLVARDQLRLCTWSHLPGVLLNAPIGCYGAYKTLGLAQDRPGGNFVSAGTRHGWGCFWVIFPCCWKSREEAKGLSYLYWYWYWYWY